MSKDNVVYMTHWQHVSNMLSNRGVDQDAGVKREALEGVDPQPAVG